MDVDDPVDIVQSYTSLIDNFQELIYCFEENRFKRYQNVHHKLLDCSQQLDNIITLETNHNNFVALCQQKQQFTMMTDIIEALIKEQSENNIFNEHSSQYPCFHTSSLKPSQNTPTKKNRMNHPPEDILTTTEEIPKVDGLYEIIGLPDVKKVLRSLVILPKTQPQLFYDRRLCNSILLYGPPGTGKTRLVHALAAEAHARFHCVSASDVLSHYVGQTEKKIKSLFQNLKESCEFSILFIDEIDALCRKRTENEQEHTRRIKTEFMCQMSSIADCTSTFVICATNCPWDLDAAIVRRLQKRIYIPLPNQIERLEFFQFLTNNIHFERNLNEWTLLIQKTDGYSGSDLCDVVQTALTFPLNELEDTKVWKCCSDGFYEPVVGEQDFSKIICSELRDLPCNSVRARKVHLNDLFNAVDVVKRTITKADVDKYEIFNRM